MDRLLVLLLVVAAETAPLVEIKPIGPEPELIEGEYGDYFEGDIVMPKETRNMRPDKLWPSNTVYYTMDSTVDSSTRTLIQGAIQEISSKTCVRWVPNNGQRAYVNFHRPASGCNSPVGRTGGKQTINLGRGCNNHGVIVHEMLHAMGFHHEHNRPDRDRYVTVMWNNVQSTYQHAFRLQSSSKTLGLPYDYGSIMHYNARGFSTNGQPTLVPKDGNTAKIGQRKGLSTIDVTKVKTLYSCGNTGGVRVTNPPVVTQRPSGNSCVDQNTNCAYWSRQGECQRNPNYMLRYCKKSCSVDKNSSCSAWAARGECQKNPRYMLSYCKKSCNTC